jgi:RHS repeat-associated protein
MDRLSDDKTGLIYANARHLDPDTGRFLSFDPFEGYDNKPISLHRYLYAYQNPARYVDKDGEEALQIGAVVGTAFFLSETIAYLSSDPDGNGQSVASEIGTATAQFVDDVKTAAVDYYARQAVALLSAGVMEGEVSPNTALVHDVPERGSDDHPADADFNRPRIDTTPIVESLPGRMETPYHDKSPEEYILSTPSRAGDIDSGLMLAELPQKTQGDIGEEKVRQRLLNSSNLELVGEQIRIVTPHGARYTDFLIETASGRRAVIEVKTGNATRDGLQLLKDNDMASPEVDTYYKGRKGRAAGIDEFTRTGRLRTFEVNADRLKEK